MNPQTVPSPQDSRDERDWLRVTLSSIGDGVISTDLEGRITLLNPVAQALTGWSADEAIGQPLESVFRILREDTRAPGDNPAVRALREGVIIGLANHTLLVHRDGSERPIDDSAAPICDAHGKVAGVVLVFRDVSERRRQEQLVAKGRAYAESILDTMHQPFLVLDDGMNVVTANRAFCNTFRVTREDTEGCALAELGNGQWDIPRLRELLAGVLPQEQAFEGFEFEREFPGVGRRFIRLNARRIGSPGDASPRILVAITDLTDHKHAQSAAVDNRSRFETLFQTSPIGMYLVDSDLRIQLVNQVARPVFGDLGELTGRPLTEVIHILWPAEAADDIVRRFQHTLVTGEAFESPSYSEVRLDRNVREHYDWQIHRTLMPDGQRGVLCSFIDTTARMVAQQEVHESEVRYRRLFESAKDGILILDFASGRVTDANPFMSTLLGYSSAEFIGKELWEIGLFKDKAASEAAMRELQEKSYIRYEHLPLESIRGRRVEVEIVANAYQEGPHSVIQCNIRDITERSLLEAKTLEQANVLADIDRRKDEFLAMLSHELRNPLAPISNAVQLLRMQGDDVRLREQAHGIIERQVAQLNRIVDDLLEIARISTGRIQLRLERVEWSDVVDRAIETALPLIDQRRHVLTVVKQPRSVALYADPARLEQVVVNLLANAAKYTEDGGEIRLSVAQEGDEAVLRVRDTGIGIAPAMMPHIFDLFTQADHSLDRSQGGLGIGLALVQRLVELHRGRIDVSSVLGKGSEFVVRLPVVHTPAPPTVAASPIAAPAAKSRRVMVVDDNRDLIESLALLLQRSGHSVQMVTSGPAVLQAAIEGRPEVILMDIGLPGLDGYEVAKQLRLEPSLAGVVLVAVTGYGQQSDRHRSQEAGFDHHLVKPADFQKIKDILASVSEPDGRPSA